MDEKLKDALRRAYEPPAPRNKAVFLRQFREPLTGYAEFFINQAGYIKKRLVLMAFLLLGATVLWNICKDILTASAMSAFMPFLILFTVTEFSRSVSFNMAELEMSCRYSLADIVLVRCFILGVMQLLCIAWSILLCQAESGAGLLMTAAAILTPYLLSLCLSLAYMRRRGVRKIYVSVFICCFVSFGCISARVMASDIFPGIAAALNSGIYDGSYNGLTAAVLMVLGLLSVYEFTKFKRKLVDNEWNLSLTD